MLVNISVNLHLVVREIKIIFDQWNISTTPAKIKAHQDDRLEFEELTWQEKVNTFCNERAKALIVEEDRETLASLLICYHTLLLCSRLE